MKPRVYLDWNATTPLRPEARMAMVAAMDLVGNPSSVHAEGRAAKSLLEKARAQIASALNVVIQIGRLSDGRRRLLSVSEIVGMEGETITMQEIFRFRMQGRDENNMVIGHFEATGIRPKLLDELAAHGVSLNSDLFRPDKKIE